MKTFWKKGAVAVAMMTSVMAGAALGSMGPTEDTDPGVMRPLGSCLSEYNLCKNACPPRDNDCKALCYENYQACLNP